MNRPLFAMAGVLCFAAGWWIDSLISGASKAEPVSEHLNPQTKQEPAHPAALPESGVLPAKEFSIRAQPVIRSADDLLKLIVHGQHTASRARLSRALAGLSAAELAALAVEFKALMAGGNEFLSEEVIGAASALAEQWLAVDPAPALDFMLGSLQHVTSLYPPFMKAMQRVFETDLPAATRLMAKTKDRETYIYARHDWVQSLKGTSPVEALTMIVEFDAQTQNEWRTAQSLGDAPERWINEDPVAAMTWALTLAPGYTRQQILQGMATAWGKSDPKAVSEFLEAVPTATLPKGNLRSQLTENIRQAKPQSSSDKKGSPPR